MVQTPLYIYISEFKYLTKDRENAGHPGHYIFLGIATDIMLLCVYIRLCLYSMGFPKN